ncbi:hypothetical protein D3C76_1558560 [compost metagenome]
MHSVYDLIRYRNYRVNFPDILLPIDDNAPLVVIAAAVVPYRSKQSDNLYLQQRYSPAARG